MCLARKDGKRHAVSEVMVGEQAIREVCATKWVEGYVLVLPVLLFESGRGWCFSYD